MLRQEERAGFGWPYFLMNNEKHSFYQDDTERGILWIVPPKCASSSIARALRNCFERIPRDEALARNQGGTFTIASIRHPLDRAVGGVYRIAGERGVSDFAVSLRRLIEEDNWHVTPQHRWIDGFRVDFPLRFEHLQEDWDELSGRYPLNNLQHQNHNPYRNVSWQDATDWSEFMPYYQNDFTLNSDWERP